MQYLLQIHSEQFLSRLKRLSFNLNGEEVAREVVGIVRTIGPDVVFTNARAISKQMDPDGANYLLLGMDTNDVAGER